ncbi:MAG: HdeD family acid-resistance protein [Dehalococcoidia bacterium]|nr:HdeD family acid-resistance protein [Dehalococcoidia bacterium]
MRDEGTQYRTEAETVIPGMGVAWWRYIVRGSFFVAFGIIALVWPGITLGVLIALFGALLILDGIIASIFALSNRERNWGWTLFGGLVAIALGIAILAWPELTALAILFLIGAWALVLGILITIMSIARWGEIRNAWLLLLTGILSIIVGIALLAAPVEGALAIIWLIGAWAIAIGILMFVLAFRVRSAQRSLREPRP